jgi:hypothetical protein
MVFRKLDGYGKGRLVYANPVDGAGFADLYEVGGLGSGGTPLKLIGRAFARASSPDRAKAGYYFVDLACDDYSIDCGLCAVPASYKSTGISTFIIDVKGTVYMKDTGGSPVTTYPADPDAKGWVPAGQ